MSVYLNGILYFQLFRQTGKQEFRHGSVLWNKGREVRSEEHTSELQSQR